MLDESLPSRRTALRIQIAKVLPNVGLALTGADIKTIQSFSGHESLKMIMRFAHPVDSAIDGALEKLDSSTPPVETIEMHYTKITPNTLDADPDLSAHAPN